MMFAESGYTDCIVAGQEIVRWVTGTHRLATASDLTAMWFVPLAVYLDLEFS